MNWHKDTPKPPVMPYNTLIHKNLMIELPEELKDINLQQMIWDKIVAENKEMHDKQMTDVLYDKFDINI